MNDKIRNLEREIELEKEKMNHCDHVWNKPYSNPETIQEEYFTGNYENHGVHHWPITSYRDKVIPRWTRVCEKCGKEEHTYNEKPIIKGYEPEF